MNNINTKRRKILFIICMMFVFVTISSLFYIVKEENHYCTGEDCPICAVVHQAEQTLKSMGTGVTDSTLNLILLVSVLIISFKFVFIFCTSLVSQKVRLNN